MYEALVVAEFVIVDLTRANPNVMYELGLRREPARGATLLVCAGGRAIGCRSTCGPYGS
jgi:hypothetical protein